MNTTEEILKILREKTRLEPGLSESELSRAEEIYGFRFPPDLRELLGAALPLSRLESDRQSFPNWREAPNDFIQDIMDWPLDGTLFDIKHDVFWFDAWGKRPDDLNEAFQVARREFSRMPPLIPICGHRFLPSEPCESGNPVLSVYQTDVIYYGSDLLEFFENEFYGKYDLKGYGTTIRKIPFWSYLTEGE